MGGSAWRFPAACACPSESSGPLSLRTTPFDEARVLMVPPGFKISVVTRILLSRNWRHNMLNANGLYKIKELAYRASRPDASSLHKSQSRSTCLASFARH
jgi:hypothetical protein